LYPETAQNLKLRALEKRSIFMYYKNKVNKRKQMRLGNMQLEAKPSKTKRTSRTSRTTRFNDGLYKSTYDGPLEDSDLDPNHITMPFKHSEELHHQILEGD